MAIAKTIEIIAASATGVEDAVKQGIAKAGETVSRIEGFWVKDIKGVVRDNKVTEWRVILAVTFIVA
ncbi:dodecin family protein [Hephaestia mangrovi]|uniref:dodecin family protein n=1 Tax=Hephaestia mangrovi TaxID=2873268 RepID=UPI001CA7A349|nr:dodecin family protein [Hephaestia mangrovi]MBY8828836.1 dodecin family protein [Hephaestia mangrovi]